MHDDAYHDNFTILGVKDVYTHSKAGDSWNMCSCLQQKQRACDTYQKVCCADPLSHWTASNGVASNGAPDPGQQQNSPQLCS